MYNYVINDEQIMNFWLTSEVQNVTLSEAKVGKELHLEDIV